MMKHWTCYPRHQVMYPHHLETSRPYKDLGKDGFDSIFRFGSSFIDPDRMIINLSSEESPCRTFWNSSAEIGGSDHNALYLTLRESFWGIPEPKGG